ncbi:hypothetical protein [Palleronia caenipelagi]|uniref:Uncharacterized protein n=1 Tax=Palleronia caenipelagi TaxID=2489174 RepID=A0A547PKY6_9RHOB|nr:hypothetical protein [Palleronia caenipelagi]TRD14809.1 hypothetical protein FEV53_18340 [Palleronia caenipelagi]
MTRDLFLWVEGCNFHHCLYDTNDLSVIRGSSAMLDAIGARLASALGRGPLWSGASTAVFDKVTDGEVDAARTALGKDGWEHLTFAIGTGTSEAAAQAAARRDQMQSWSLTDFRTDGGHMPDSFDGIRPASEQDAVKTEYWISPSVKARIDYGRNQKYSADRLCRLGADAADLDRLTLARDIDALLDNAPIGTPESVKGKLAVLHFDGDGFGAARQRAGSNASFSAALQERLKSLMVAIVRSSRFPQYDEVHLKTEVLIWGGNDITLMTPAWNVSAVIRAFHDVTQSWDAGPPDNLGDIGFTGAVIIARGGTPIRQMVAMANASVDASKAAGVTGSVVLDIFESAAVPDASAGSMALIDAYRAAKFGTNSIEDLAIPIRDWPRFEKAMRRILSESEGAGLSRSRAYGLAKGHLERITTGDRDEADTWLIGEVQSYMERVRSQSDAVEEDHADLFSLPAVAHETPLAIRLRRGLDLWDYATTSERKPDAKI